MLHEKQGWAHWLPQQKPSTQNPVAHWLLVSQAAPTVFFTAQAAPAQ